MSPKHTLGSTNSQFKLLFGPLHRISWIRFAIQSFFQQESFCIVHVTFCCCARLISTADNLQFQMHSQKSILYSLFLQLLLLVAVVLRCSEICVMLFPDAWVHLFKGLMISHWKGFIRSIWEPTVARNFSYGHSCGCLFHRSFGIRHTILWVFKSIFKGKK